MNLGRQPHPADGGTPSAETSAIGRQELVSLARAFAPPVWLRDLGRTSWLLIGLAVVVVGIIGLLALSSTIVLPVLAGLVVATVSSPIVAALARHNVPRVIGALLVVIGLAVVAVIVAVLVVAGISSQTDAMATYATDAALRAEQWLEDAGVDTPGATDVKLALEKDIPAVISRLTQGVANTIQGLTSVVFFLSFTVFSLFFLLKDGPAMRRFVDSHLGVPLPVAQTITGNVLHAMRRYFTGVTIVAVFNAVVVGLGALILDVPLAGTIAIVTAVTAYVPFIGAFVAGAFAVVIALGAKGTVTALLMLVVVLLANGVLQNIVQPIAFGATLRLNPLLILVVTISAGSIFGAVGLVLAAPLTSAGVRIVGELARARAAAAAADAAAAAPAT